MNIIEAALDPNLFGSYFSGSSWATWRAVLKATYALPMTHRERAMFRAVAERDPPRGRVRELWVVAGRRAGKDSIASLIATYAAAFVDYRPLLRPGERAVIMCLAVDRPQAKIVLSYIRGYFAQNPLLAGLVERETQHGLDLNTCVSVEVYTSDFRSVRGRTVALAILDECAFWRDETSVSPDAEIYTALKPALATLPDAMLIGISSPYRRSGLLYGKWKQHYAKDDDDVLVIQAPSRALNPTLDQRIIDDALAADPQAAQAEWLGEFRSDIAAFVDRDVVDSCTVLGRHELPPMSHVTYCGFVDPSGGSADSFTLAIAHREGDCGTLDCARERRPPFSPDDVVREYSDMLKSYNVHIIQGDRYAGQWPVKAFRKHGITYEQNAAPKSDLYQQLLPILNSGRCELLDNQRLATQLCGLERRTSRGGRDSVDHGPGQHDDLINAACGVLVAVAGKPDAMAIWRKLASAA